MTGVVVGRGAAEMEPCLSAAARAGDGPQWLIARRREAAEAFAASGLPNKKWEAWKHIDLSPLRDYDFMPPSCGGSLADDSALLGRLQPLVSAPRLVFVDGRFVATLSDIAALPAGVTVAPLTADFANAPEWLERHWSAYADPHGRPFVALNTALGRSGVAIELATDVVVEEPILVAFFTTEAAVGRAVYPRLLVDAGERSQLQLIEWHGGAPQSAYLSAPVAEWVAGADAQIDWVRIVEEGEGARHFGAVNGVAGARARVATHSFVCGGEQVRVELESVAAGDRAEVDLTGLYLARGGQFVDHHTWVHHRGEQTRSRQLFKGVLDGRSETVFDGLVKVDEGAHKTDAEQQNRNLVLSPRGLAHSNPRLEIYTDDVRCTHGSTTGRLDEEAIFYLRTRGIDAEAARALLTTAFAGEVLEAVRCRPAVEYERTLLYRFLPGVNEPEPEQEIEA